MTARALLLPLLAVLPACAGVSLTRDDRPMPRTIAVLPLQGEADPRLCTLCRALLASGLREHGLRVVETGHVDRILAESGWLADPERFVPARVDPAAACAALGVDAVLCGTAFDETSFNLFLLRRQAFGGELTLRRADGSRALAIRHTAARTGGFLLQSGQVLTALRDQGEHGTARAAAALVDEFVDEVLAALPAEPPAAAAPAPAPAATAVTVQVGKGPGGAQRLAVRGTVPPGTRVWLDVAGDASGVPASERGGAFTVARDLDGPLPDALRLRTRDAFGNAASTDVRR